MSEQKIITAHVFPPIPPRQFDWCAWFDGDEEGPQGWGETKEAAIADLKQESADMSDEPICGDWRDADTAPKEGFILVWGPHQPDIAFTFSAEIFHNGRAADMPAHLSTRGFTKWTPLPKLPSE